MDFTTILRPQIAKMKAYESARSITNETEVVPIYMDANEASALEPMVWNRYPVPQPQALLNRLSQIYKVEPQQILMGRGSDEAIDILTRTLCEAVTHSILIQPPTYGMYRVSAEIQGARVLEIPKLREGPGWKPDLPGLRAALRSDVRLKIIYFCHPNNPTGGLVALDEISEVCEMAAGRALVVVDEAYIEFSPAETAVPLLRKFSNLAILRTLSKAWALAGLRFGVVLAHPDLIQILQKVRAPYPLPSPIVQLVLNEIQVEGAAQMQKRVNMILEEKRKLESDLRGLADVESVYPSSANFILAKFKTPARAMAETKKHGIILRSRENDFGLAGCLRVTVGNPAENSRLISVLKAGIR